jgi:hypothetical protein
MSKQKIEQRNKSGWGLLKQLTPLLAVLLLSLLVSGVFAQDGPAAAEGAPIFVEDEFSATPEEVAAPNGQITIRAGRDTFVSSADPNRNYGSNQTIRFGFTQTGFRATRPMFFFDVTAVPSGARISRADFQVYLSANTDPVRDRGYAAHPLTSTWQESFVTWNNQPGWGAEMGRGTLGNTPGWQTVTVTNLVRNWQSNPGGNNGLILVGDERPDQNFERSYFSKESTTNLFPRLVVTFDTSVDDRAPTANVTQPSAGSWSPADFVVRWQGNDPNNSDGSPGSGIRWYDVFYTTNNGNNWNIGRAQVTSTQTNVTAAPNMARIGFYARARDNAGNEGPMPSGSGSIQTWTTIDASPPQVTMNPLPPYTNSTTFTVSWIDTKELQESGIRSYDVQFREADGEWQQLAYGTTSTSAVFNRGRNGVRYDFRARGTDNVGNVQPWGDAQASTTVFDQAVASITPFNPFVYQQLGGPSPSDGFTVAWSAQTPPGTSIASFDVRYQRPGNPTWITWLTGTTQTSARFDLQVGDPDGPYTFQARATTSSGVVGQYVDGTEQQIVVDRNAPFINAESAMPIIFSRLPNSGFTSGQQIQNVGSASATGILTAYAQTGAAFNCGQRGIAPGASQTYLTDRDCPLAADFFGSAIASADQSIAAITNVNNRGTGAAAGQYQGTALADADTTLYFPLVKNDHSNRTTTFYVQNVSDSPNNISAVFSVNGRTYGWNRNNVPANAMVVINPSDTNPPVPAGQGQVGSLIVTGTGPLAGSSLEHPDNVPVADNLQASKAFVEADGSTTVYCPLYRNAHTARSQTTGAQVQNIGSSSVNVQFTVSAGGQTFGPYDAAIPAGESFTFFAPSLVNPSIPNGTVGSATITSSGPVVAVVNDRGTDNGIDRLTTYGCFSSGSTAVNVPLAKEFSGGNTTGVQVQNAGSAPATATLEYRATDGRSLTIQTRNPIPAGQSVTAWGISNYPDNTWIVTSGVPSSMFNSVSGVVVRSSEPMTVIANESSNGATPSGQDTKNYEGFGSN